jgi:hypothetical protein
VVLLGLGGMAVMTWEALDAVHDGSRQMAAENALVESSPPVPGMILVHDTSGRVQRVAVDQIESTRASSLR